MAVSTATPDLVTEPLAARQIRLAYPLMQQLYPGLTLQRWERFAKRFTSARASHAHRGILAARRRTHQAPCGLVCYELKQELEWVLMAKHIVAVDLLYPEEVLHSLVAGLDRIAAQLGCASVHFMVRGQPPWLLDRLRAHGHEIAGMVLARSLVG